MKYLQKESRSTYSFETHPMNGTNQLNGTSTAMIYGHCAKVNLKLQHLVVPRGITA